MIKAGIIGVTGYTGLELIRILSSHPEVRIEVTTSESFKGKKISDIHNQLAGVIDLDLASINEIKNYELDVVFLALPHGVSMDFVKNFGVDSFKIIDLSGDFRINKDEYVKWYGTEHVCPEYLDEAIYGIPELFNKKIQTAKLIANPGCYPTSAILPLAPLLMEGLIEPDSIIIDSKSGVTGAGAKAKDTTHFPSVNDNFMAYGVFNHRHTPEIEKILDSYSKKIVDITFTPHLLPINRGILSTIYCKTTNVKDKKELNEVLNNYYNNKPFANIVDKIPSVKDVRGSNYCNIFADFDQDRNRAIIVSVLDNLVKGASGQAVQNMNIMFGLDESTGLKAMPLSP